MAVPGVDGDGVAAEAEVAVAVAVALGADGRGSVVVERGVWRLKAITRGERAG